MKGLRKNIPIENDGSIHECAQFKTYRKNVKKMDREALSPEEIARYEKGMNRAVKK